MKGNINQTMDFDFSEELDQEIVIDQESSAPDEDPIVDRVEHGPDWIKGYKDGVVVAEYHGIRDFSAIRLYDEAGNMVEPEAPAMTETEQLEMAITELTMLMGGMLRV